MLKIKSLASGQESENVVLGEVAPFRLAADSSGVVIRVCVLNFGPNQYSSKIQNELYGGSHR